MYIYIYIMICVCVRAYACILMLLVYNLNKKTYVTKLAIRSMDLAAKVRALPISRSEMVLHQVLQNDARGPPYLYRFFFSAMWDMDLSPYFPLIIAIWGISIFWQKNPVISVMRSWLLRRFSLAFLSGIQGPHCNIWVSCGAAACSKLVNYRRVCDVFKFEKDIEPIRFPDFCFTLYILGWQCFVCSSPYRKKSLILLVHSWPQAFTLQPWAHTTGTTLLVQLQL